MRIPITLSISALLLSAWLSWETKPSACASALAFASLTAADLATASPRARTCWPKASRRWA